VVLSLLIGIADTAFIEFSLMSNNKGQQGNKAKLTGIVFHISQYKLLAYTGVSAFSLRWLRKSPEKSPSFCNKALEANLTGVGLLTVTVEW